MPESHRSESRVSGNQSRVFPGTSCPVSRSNGESCTARAEKHAKLGEREFLVLLDRAKTRRLRKCAARCGTDLVMSSWIGAGRARADISGVHGKIRPLGEINDFLPPDVLNRSCPHRGWSKKCRTSRSGDWLEANRRRDGDWHRNALSARQGGFQNSGKGFLNLVRMPSERIKCTRVVS